MALTAMLRTFIITAVGLGLGWLAQKLGLEGLDLKGAAEVIGSLATVFLAGGFAWVVNKLGSRFPILNQIVSLGRSKSPSIYVPAAADTVTATLTPPGDQTITAAVAPDGARIPAPV